MQPPTCAGIRVRSPSDAMVIIHAVNEGILPMVHRRLDTDERRAIQSGCVYVWEERGPNAEATGTGIERWTDSISWGPSRVRDEFLFYHERKPVQPDPGNSTDSSSDTGFPIPHRYSYSRQPLVKQTYSVFVATHNGLRKKWHLIAYFTQDTVDKLGSIADHPQLRMLSVPKGIYVCARSAKGRHRQTSSVNSFEYFASLDSGHYTGINPSHYTGINCGPCTGITSPDAPIGLVVPIRPINPSQRLATLAPLAYLRRLPPPPRHVLDQVALMSFSGLLTSDESIRRTDSDSYS